MQASWRGFGILLVAFSFGSIATQPASALSITPNPLDLTYFDEEVVARITFVGSVTGTPTDGITLRGTVAPTDVSLLFTVEYIAQSISNLGFVGVTRSSGSWSAVGWIPGSNVDWSDAFQLVGGTAQLFSGLLDTGDTSDVFFVSASSIPDGTSLEFYFQGYHGVPYGTGTATVVPEPATLALVAAGLAIVATRRRR
jgi:hypothetical protein